MFPKRSLISLLIFAIVALLAACGGGGSDTPTGPGPVSSVELAPTSISLEPGQVGQVAATVRDADDDVILNETVTYASSNTAIQVSNGGLVCAGTWDSLTTPIVCTPTADPGAAGISSNITATAAGVTSNAVPVSVHRHIENIVVSTTAVDCKSNGETQQFTATAFAGGVDITSSVGPFSWSVGDSTIASTDQNGLVTARGPGATTVVASASGTTSLGATFRTCMPASINITVQNASDTSFTVASAATRQLVATVIDTHGNPSTATLRWNSSASAVAQVNNTGLVTGLNPGITVITASCTPPACGAGVNEQVFSNPVLATVTGTASSFVYVGGTSTTSLIPINVASGNSVGTAITLPHQPNSAMFDPGSVRLFLGSSNGLMILDPSSNQVTGTVTNVLGRVLAISPDGLRVITSDVAADRLFIFSGDTNTVETLIIPNGTQAAFSPDSFKAFILSDSTLYVWSPSLSLKTVAYGTALGDVDFQSTGQYAYITSTSLGMRATCRNDSTASFDETTAAGSTTSLVRAIPDGGGAVLTTATGIAEVRANGGGGCPPLIGVGDVDSADFGVAYTPKEVFVRGDSQQAMVVSNAAVFAYGIASNTAGALPKPAGVTQIFPGGYLTTANWFYVGMTTGTNHFVHVYDAATGDTISQIPMDFVPDLVAVRPK